MASPVVEQVVESSTNTAGTSHVVTLPTATAGQLLLIILDKGSTAATINAHASLTELLDENSANGLYIAYRWMDGTEPSSYTLTSSASTRSAVMAYRISGAENPAVTPPAIGTTGTGTSATPDPPASAAPPSSKDYLFIAFYGAAGEEADDNTWSDTPPTNYTPSPPRQKSCGTAGTNLGGLIASAERALTTGSAENPGTFAKDVSAAWRSQTILIHPGPQTIPAPVSDTLGATETFIKEVDKTIAETVALTEARLLSVGKTVSDTLGLAEGFSAVVTQFKAVGDTLGLTESNLRQVNKTVGETVALTETFVKSLDRQMAETVALTETRLVSVETRFAETVALAEAIAFQFFKTFQETVGLTEELETITIPAAGGNDSILHPHLQFGCTFQGIMRVGEI